MRPRAGEAFRFSAQSLSLPLGLAYVAAALEQAGHPVSVVDAVGAAPRRAARYFKGYLVGLDDTDVVARVPSDAAVVGVSVLFTHEWPATVALLRTIRRARPDVTIVLGGEHVTAMPEFCLLTSPADVIVLGEGEQTIVELVAALEGVASGDGPRDVTGAAHRNGPRDVAGAASRARLRDVAGIAYRDGDRVVVNPRRPRREDVDAIARPAWHLFDIAGYSRAGFVGGVDVGRVTVPLLATRGCPYQCTYCTNPNMWTTRWIARTPRDVVDEMEWAGREFGASHFPLQDLTAILDRDWIVAFCREILDRGLDVRWQMPTGTRAEAVDDEVAVLLRRSGMIGMAYAPESGSETTRTLIKKQMRTDALLASVAAASRAGLGVAVFLVAGFPHDTRRSLRESLALVPRLVEAGATEVSSGFYMNLPGTQLFDSQFEAGRITLDRTFFGHVLQSTELWPSRSWCEQIGRVGLTLWTLRLYASFFARRAWARWRRAAPRDAITDSSSESPTEDVGATPPPTVREGRTGRWHDAPLPRGKLADALRFAARSLATTARTRLGRRWIPRAEETRMLASWDAIHREIRRRLSEGAPVETAPADARELHHVPVARALRRAHGARREIEVPIEATRAARA